MKRILVVDDDRAMVDSLCDVLALNGWTTFRAYDGAEATRAVAAQPVDVVLMDVRMPRMNGIEALRAMKAAHPAARVVLMTAFAAADLLAQAERDGALRILSKPVDIRQMMTVLDGVAAGRKPILVVDDNPAALQSIRELLTSLGLDTLTARTIPEALDQLERAGPAAVLLDLRLDGVIASEQLVAFRRVDPTVLLILYSGDAVRLDAAMHETPTGLVAAAFTKPIPIDRLLAVIGRLA